MRYRTLSPTGDYVFGQGTSEFLVNSPDAVAQAIATRLRLATNEWFLNLDEGTPYATQILGTGTQQLYDQAIQARILGTPGVKTIDQYASVLDQDRALRAACTVTTIYGEISGVVAIENPYPPTPGRLDIDFILDRSALI